MDALEGWPGEGDCSVATGSGGAQRRRADCHGAGTLTQGRGQRRHGPGSGCSGPRGRRSASPVPGNEHHMQWLRRAVAVQLDQADRGIRPIAGRDGRLLTRAVDGAPARPHAITALMIMPARRRTSHRRALSAAGLRGLAPPEVNAADVSTTLCPVGQQAGGVDRRQHTPSIGRRGGSTDFSALQRIGEGPQHGRPSVGKSPRCICVPGSRRAGAGVGRRIELTAPGLTVESAVIQFDQRCPSVEVTAGVDWVI